MSPYFRTQLSKARFQKDSEAYSEIIELVGRRLLAVSNQLSYCVEQINLGFENDIKTKMFWAMQVQDFVEEIKLFDFSKITEEVKAYKKQKLKLPIEESKIDMILEMASLIQRMQKDIYEEYQASNQKMKYIKPKS